MGEELKPCPFCGGKCHNYSTSRQWLGCKDCGCELPIYQTRAEAIAAWNRRTQGDQS